MAAARVRPITAALLLQYARLFLKPVRPAMLLTEIIYTLYDFLTWNNFSTHDEGLSHEDSQWFRQQDLGRFPLDRRPLKRRELNLTVKPIDPK